MTKQSKAQDPLVTKEGIRVEPGQIWQDLDKRMYGRKVTVTEIVDPVVGKVRVKGAGCTVISVRRMHKSSTGYQPVSGPGIDRPSTLATGHPLS